MDWKNFLNLIKRLALAWFNEEHPYVKRGNDILIYLLPFILSLGSFVKARSKAEEKELQGAAEITYALALIGSTGPKDKRMVTGIYTLISVAAFGRNVLNQKNANIFVLVVGILLKMICNWLFGRK